jgi:hypothetical protein
MSPFQKKLLADTAKTVNPLTLATFAVNVLVSSLIVLLFFWLVTETFDWLISGIVVGITAVYNVLRTMLNRYLNGRMMERQYAYALKKHPDITLYVPVFDTTSGIFQLKPTAIVFAGEEGALLTYKQPLFARLPQDSIRVPLGKDFTINALEIVPGKPFAYLTITLMTTQVKFGILQEASVLTRLPITRPPSARSPKPS